ncbi:DUF502 domain-containing protein [Bacteroidota bacterium]
MKDFFKGIVSYFFQGLLFITPIGVTLFVIVWFVRLIDEIFFPLTDGFIPWHIPGLGLTLAFILLSVVGYIIAHLISLSAINWFDRLMKKAPLVKVIYFAVKDMITVFFGKEEKLGKPVKVLVQRDPKQYKFGFVTRSDMSEFGFDEDMISVYLPYSYGVMGNQIVVKKEDTEELSISSAEMMKFIVSGGVVRADEKSESSFTEQ